MKKSLNQLYDSPLPLKVRPLPPIIPHNPLSLLYLAYEYLFPRPAEKILCRGVLSSDGLFVKVKDPKDMETLWSMGFFGKGTLSRSEPTWYPRTARRLGLEGGEQLTSEDVTHARRQERKKFKQQRAKAEKEELERRKQLDEVKTSIVLDINSNNNSNDDISSSGRKVGSGGDDDNVSNSPKVGNDVSPPSILRHEDQQIIDENGKLIQQEYLQLMPQEVFFLKYGLDVLQVEDESGYVLSSEDLLRRFVSVNNRFIADYVVYHHYRSLGWCVRSGVKFGTDFILYRRGPPFTHAEFAVSILLSPSDEQRDWWWNTSVGRVIGGVKKTLVFCYVQGNDNSENVRKILGCSGSSTSRLNIKEILQSYTIREVVYRRWIATRNRD